MTRLMQLKDYTTICSPAPAEVLGLMGMEAQAILTDRSRGYIDAGFDAWELMLRANPEVFDWTRPVAGPISFVRLKNSALSAASLMKQLLDKEGVLVLPGSVYDAAYSDCFRIGVGRASSPAAIREVGRFLSRNGLNLT